MVFPLSALLMFTFVFVRFIENTPIPDNAIIAHSMFAHSIPIFHKKKESRLFGKGSLMTFSQYGLQANKKSAISLILLRDSMPQLNLHVKCHLNALFS